MTWLAVLKLFLLIADKIAEYVGDKQLIEAGEQRAISTGLKNVLSTVEKAKNTVGQFRRDPAYAKRVRDTYTRTDE